MCIYIRIYIHIFLTVYSSLYGFIWNQHHDQLPVGLLAQLVERCTGIVEVMGSNPVQAWIFFRPYFHYCPSSAHYCEDHFHSQKKYYATMIFPPFFTFAVRRSPFLPLAHSWDGRPLCGERIDSFISKIHARKLCMCDSGWYQQEPGVLYSENIL